VPLITNVFRNSSIIFGISASKFIRNKVTNLALEPTFLFTNVLPILHPLNMLIIVLSRLSPHKLVMIWNANMFVQKCGSIHDGCMSFHLCRTRYTHINLHYTWLHFCQHLHFYGWLPSHFRYFFLLYVLLHYLSIEISLFHTFIFFQFFNVH